MGSRGQSSPGHGDRLVAVEGSRAQITDAAQDASTVEEVVVTGQRASDRDSLLKKRDAVSAVEVVSANDVGKLPDQNVAEAVRRLPGLSVANDQGEGRYLSKPATARSSLFR